MAKTLALCADDFGSAPGISSGIARLAHAKRLTGIACITNGPYWPDSAALLRELPESVDVGLHLNFTEGRPLSRRLAKHWRVMPTLPRLIASAHLGLLPRAAVRGEVHAQLAAFIRDHGHVPKFVDGHQHVMHLPMLRDIVLDIVEHVQPQPALRNTGHVLGPGAPIKRWLIERTGGRALARTLQRCAMAHNRVLLGAYDFKNPDYRTLMRGWLASMPDKGALVFCHPGEQIAGDPPDAIAAARARELAYLAGEGFATDLALAGVKLGRAWKPSGTSSPG